MKHILSLFESNQDNLKLGAEVLIEAFSKKWSEHPNTVGKFTFRYSDDIRDAKPAVVVSQYGDYFFIVPLRITKLELPILDILLSEPFNGGLYPSRQDGQLQVRISGLVAERMLKTPEES